MNWTDIAGWLFTLGCMLPIALIGIAFVVIMVLNIIINIAQNR